MVVRCIYAKGEVTGKVVSEAFYEVRGWMIWLCQHDGILYMSMTYVVAKFEANACNSSIVPGYKSHKMLIVQ